MHVLCMSHICVLLGLESCLTHLGIPLSLRSLLEPFLFFPSFPFLFFLLYPSPRHGTLPSTGALSRHLCSNTRGVRVPGIIQLFRRPLFLPFSSLPLHPFTLVTAALLPCLPSSLRCPHLPPVRLPFTSPSFSSTFPHSYATSLFFLFCSRP